MGTVWAVLLVIGMLAPVFVLLATGAWVVRLARRIRVLDVQARPPWQLLLLHIALVLGAQLLATVLPWPPVLGVAGQTGLAALLAMAVMPYRLNVRLKQIEAGAVRPGPDRRLAEESIDVRDRTGGPPARSWGLAAFFTLTGLLLPWAVGVGVKMYLDAHGRPTLPYSDFLSFSGTPVLLVISLVTWAFPFLILSALLLAPKGDLERGPSPRRILPYWLAFGVGFAVAIPVFVGVFWEFDAIYLIMPIGVLLLVPMAAAYGLGILMARHSASIEARRAPS